MKYRPVTLEWRHAARSLADRATPVKCRADFPAHKRVASTKEGKTKQTQFVAVKTFRINTFSLSYVPEPRCGAAGPNVAERVH